VVPLTRRDGSAEPAAAGLRAKQRLNIAASVENMDDQHIPLLDAIKDEVISGRIAS